MSAPNEHWAELDGDTVVGVYVCDNPEWAETMGWLRIEELEPMPWLGWTRDGDGWSPPPPEPEPVA